MADQNFSEEDLIAVAQKVNQCVDSMTPERWLKEGVVIENGQLIETNLYYKTCIRGETDQAKIDRCWEGSTFATRNKKYVEIYCKAKVKEENPSGPNPFTVPLDKDPELEKKRKIAKSQDDTIKKSQEKIDKKNELLKSKKDQISSLAQNAARAAVTNAVASAVSKLTNNSQLAKLSAQVANVAAGVAAASAVLGTVLKARQAIKDKKMKAKKEAAEAEKKVKEERAELTKENVNKSVETYSYPLTPQPTPSVSELPVAEAPPPVVPPTPTATPTPTPAVRYYVDLFYQAQSLPTIPEPRYRYTIYMQDTEEEVWGPFNYPISETNTVDKLINSITNKIKTEGFGENKPPQTDFEFPGRDGAVTLAPTAPTETRTGGTTTTSTASETRSGGTTVTRESTGTSTNTRTGGGSRVRVADPPAEVVPAASGAYKAILTLESRPSNSKQNFVWRVIRNSDGERIWGPTWSLGPSEKITKEWVINSIVEKAKTQGFGSANPPQPDFSTKDVVDETGTTTNTPPSQNSEKIKQIDARIAQITARLDVLSAERKKLEKEIVDAPTQEEAIKISDKNEPRLDEISAEESKLLNEKQELEADKVQLSRNR